MNHHLRYVFMMSEDSTTVFTHHEDVLTRGEAARRGQALIMKTSSLGGRIFFRGADSETTS